MGIKLSALPAAEPLAGTEITPIVQAGATRRTTTAAIAALAVQGVVKTDPFTVSTLPSASANGAGSRAFVTDSTVAAAGNFGAGVGSGGGSNKVPVYSDGTSWLIG